MADIDDDVTATAVEQKDETKLKVTANAGLNLNTSSLLTGSGFSDVFGSEDVTDNGSIQIANKKINIDDCEDDTDWTARGEASGLTTSVEHTEGTKSLSFDKSGVGGTVGYIDRTVTSIDLSAFQTHAIMHMHVYLSDVSQVSKVFLRLGTDSSNYHQYDFLVMEAGWNDLDIFLTGRTSQTGNGADLSAITYVAIGVEMDANGHTLSGILVDNVTAKRMTEVLSFGAEAVEMATRVRIQDNNTGRLLEINASKEALVHETDAASIKTAVESINGTLDTILTAVEKIDNQEDSITWVDVAKAGVDGDIIAAPEEGFLRIHHIYVNNWAAKIVFFHILDDAAGTRKFSFCLAASGGAVAQNLKRPLDLSERKPLYYDYVSGAVPNVYITVGYENIIPGK